MKGSDSQRARAQVKERRKGPRLRVNPLVYLNISPDNGGFLFDLGEGGMGIRVANPVVSTARIQFSFLLEDHQLVEGTGDICWLSETGRSAGVRFVRFPGDCQNRVREWLRAGVRQAQEGQSPRTSMEVVTGTARPQESIAAARLQQHVAEAHPQAAVDKVPAQTSPVLQEETQKTASSFTIFAPPPSRPGAMGPKPSAADQPPTEGSQHLSMPQTPLFFLPRKTDQEEEPDSSEATEPFQQIYRPAGQPLNNKESEETAALQSAVLLGSPAEQPAKREKPRSGKVWMGAALCAALAALLGLAILPRSSPGVLAKFHRLVSTMELQYAPQPVATTIPSARLERRLRRGRGLLLHRRGSQTSRMRDVFHSPSAAGVPSPVSATGLLPQPLPGTLSGQTVALGQPAGVTVSVTSSAPHLQFGGVMRDLRDDGALVEEGVPVSPPSDLDSQSSLPKSIVVDAVIGQDGAVKSVRLLSPPGSKLAQAVVSAVKQWRYRPVYENGKPVEFSTRITFDFSLQRNKP